MKDSVVPWNTFNSASTKLWRASGPLLTTVVLAAVELLRLLMQEPPYPLPIFLLLIVYAAMSGGLRAGLISALLTVLYSFRYFAAPGSFLVYSDADLQQLISNVVVMPITALLVGLLKLRADRLASGELRASENRFQATFEQAAVGIAHVALDGSWLRVNHRLCDLLGYSREELLAGRVHDVTHPADRDRDLLSFTRLLDNPQQTYTQEQRYVRKDGSSIWTSLTVSLVRLSSQQPDYCIAVISDIMAQKRVEAALRESETRYRRLFEASPEAMWVVDAQTLHFLEVNDTAVARYGYSRAEFSTMTIHDLRSGEDVQLEQPRSAPDALTGIWRHHRRDGSRLWVDLVSHRIELGGRDAVLMLATDMTKRKEAELALAAEKERLAVTLRSLNDGVITTDTAGSVVLLNPAAERLTGWTQAEAGGRSLDLILALADEQPGQPYERLVAPVLQHGAIQEQTRPLLLRSRNETRRLIKASSTAVRDHAGHIIGALLVFRDITEQARMEQQLQQAQKMESIGLLAGGIAHDFNNMLTGIIGTADLALMDAAPDTTLYEDLQNIKKQGLHGATLTKQLLAFSRRQILEPKFVNLNDVVHEVEQFIRRVLGARIEFVFTPEPELAPVYADPVQIEQVLLNLCINARDAMPQGGQLLLATANVEVDAAFCRAHAGVQPGPYVQLTVRDTGQGMEPDTLRHVFEPFFTTKEPGKGTGLGLAMVYGIVAQHNGLIHVHSVVGQGATFTLLLPVAAVMPNPANPVPEVRPVHGTETILVIEDEAAVRDMVARSLAKHGYATLIAVDGIEAVEVFEQHHARIELVVLDVLMPKLDGRAVYDALRAINPSIKVLFVSGYGAAASDARLRIEPEHELLNKPFDPLALVQRVRSLLDSPARSGQVAENAQARADGI